MTVVSLPLEKPRKAAALSAMRQVEKIAKRFRRRKEEGATDAELFSLYSDYHDLCDKQPDWVNRHPMRLLFHTIVA